MADATEKKYAFEQMEVRRKSERIWRGNPNERSLWNRPIRLKIYLTDCWLYSFRFGYAAGG